MKMKIEIGNKNLSVGRQKPPADGNEEQ